MDNKQEKDEVVAEERILAAAIEEFTQKGFAGARMQSIADKAKISKSALHYYFRHKEKLFRLVLDKTVGRILNKLWLDLSGLESFNEKLEYGFRYYYQAINKNIKVVKFIFWELNRNPVLISEFLKERNFQTWIDSFNLELEAGYQAGRIRKIKAEQLMMNIASMCIFPHLGEGIITQVLDLDHPAYQKMLLERQELVLQFIKDAIFIEEK